MSFLKEIEHQAAEIGLTLVSFWQPWVVWKYRRELAHVQAELAAGGVEFDMRSLWLKEHVTSEIGLQPEGNR